MAFKFNPLKMWKMKLTFHKDVSRSDRRKGLKICAERQNSNGKVLSMNLDEDSGTVVVHKPYNR